MRFRWLAIVLVVSFGFVSLYAEIPKWATQQLSLRSLIHESITETQKWQNEDGAIYKRLNMYRWDDEVEIFYSWLALYYLTGDEGIYESVKKNALHYIQRGVDADMFDHGYYKDAWFDTEHTIEGLITLASLAWAKPGDSQVIEALEDIVEHAGNWVQGYAPWTAEETHLMRSTRPGTRKVESSGSAAIDWVFNLQFAKMAMAAYHATHKERYLTWCRNYVEAWISIMEKNFQENGYYVIPSSVDPYTGEIGPYSGVWWQSKFGTGWGWDTKGNNGNRDMRGAFLDLYRLTTDIQYLQALKRQIQTLFNEGDKNRPAHKFDGQSWIDDDDKVTVAMAVQISLLDQQTDEAFDDFINNWYLSLRYPYPDMHMWCFQKYGGLDKIDEINQYAKYSARNALEVIKALTGIPGPPDDWPRVGGMQGLTLVPFGGVQALRGEMPWMEVMYFKQDRSLGLDEGVAALFQKNDPDYKLFSICNTNQQDKTVWVQAGYLARPIRRVFVEGQPATHLDGFLAKLVVPAQSNIQVRLELGEPDTTPPAPPQNLDLAAIPQ